MFDFDSSGGVESLELGSRRRPVKWAVELSLADCRPQKHKARYGLPVHGVPCLTTPPSRHPATCPPHTNRLHAAHILIGSDVPLMLLLLQEAAARP
jgi:hypothetical protein